MATENITHVFESLAISLRANLHVDLIRGRNDHHRAEAAFKACALALRSSYEPVRVPIHRPGCADMKVHVIQTASLIPPQYTQHLSALAVALN